MGKLAHAARSKPGPVSKPRAAAPKAKTKPRAKASWTFGGFEGGKSLAAVGAQPKMEVSKPEDALELEADRIADRVMHGHAGGAGGARPGGDEMRGGRIMRAAEEDALGDVQRKAQSQEEIEREERRGSESDDPMKHAQRKAEKDHEEEKKKVHRMAMDKEDDKKVHRMAMDEEDDKKVHRMAVGKEDEKKVHRFAEGHGEGEARDPEREAGGAFEDRLRFAQLGGGAALAGPLAAFMESRFGTSFRRVRVHVGAAGAALARSVRARAFTVGRHIFFGPGAYQPHTEQGRRLIAHELTHVMQQRGGLHSVQREVETAAPPVSPRAEKDAAAPDMIPFERFMKAFNLRESETPPQVLEIIKEMVERALHHLPQAEKLLPLLQPLRSAEQLVRRVLRSRSHELRLETAKVGGTGAQTTKWVLRFFDRTRADATGGVAPGGTDEDTIDVGDTGRPREPAEPGADLKEELRKKPSPAAPGMTAAAAAPEAAAVKGAAATRAAEAAEAVAAPVGATAEEPGPVEAAAAVPGAAAVGAVSATAKKAVAAAEEKIPKKPEDDPNFKAVVRGADKAKKQSAAHGKAGPTALNAEEAAPVDAAERQQLKQDKQVDQMSVQVTPGLEVDELVTAIEKKVAEKTPQSLEEARNFKNAGTVGEIGRDVRARVGAEADKTRAPLKSATDADPAKIAVTPRTASTLAEARIGAKPKDLDAGRAVPPELPASHVEGVIEKNQQAVDAQMKEIGVPEKTLRAATEEPQVAAVVAAKDNFSADAAAAPRELRNTEAAERAGARKDNAETGAKGVGDMFDARTGLIGRVQKGQRGGKVKSESQHERVKREVNETYERTKTNVHDRLERMQKTAFEKFDTDSKAALSEFENAVVAAEKRWNDKGWFARQKNRLVTWVNGLPNDLERDLGVIRRFFIDRMKRIVRDIAEMAARELKAAKQEVKDGRAEIKTKLDTLGKGQEDLKAELTKEFDGKFDALEVDIKKAREAVVGGLAERYKATQATIDKRLAEVQERNKGFFAKLKDKVVGFIEALGEMKEKLKSVFKKAGFAILRIVADPKTFMKNLFAGIGQGFENFGKNIKKHLIDGAVSWLTGAVGSTGVEIPTRPFTPEKILGLFLQLAGLTIENIKLRARMIWGDKVVDAIETGVAGAEAAIELFDLFKKEGIVGVVRRLFDKIIALKDQALEKIKETIEVAIVKKAIEFLLTLLTPVGALIQAVITIVNTVLFFIRNASRIAALINTIVDSVNDVLNGNVSALAQKVENALGMLVPVVLDFLATLLKIGSTIVTTVKEVIAFVRRPVETAIDFMLTGIKSVIGPFIARVMGGFGGRPAQSAAAAPRAAAPGAAPPRTTAPGAAPAPAPPTASEAGGPIGTSIPFEFTGEQHTLFIRETDKDANLLVKSHVEKVMQFLEEHNVDQEDAGLILQLAFRVESEAGPKSLLVKKPTTRAQFNEIKKEEEFVEFDERQLASELAKLGTGEGPPGQATFRLDSRGRPQKMEAVVTPLFVATHQGTEPGFAPPGWVDKVDFPKGISLGRGHLLPNSVGGDGGRPGNLMTLEQHKINAGQFAQNENNLRAALKGGWSVSYSVEPTYADIPVNLGKAEGIKRIPDPIPRTINVSGQIVGRRRPLSRFVEPHVNFKIPALSQRADFGITNPVIGNFISGADYNADPFRQDMARRFREQGR